MPTSSSTPLWLEIKTEYIDANIHKVIAYLSRASAETEADPFYKETKKLLGTRIGELIEQLAHAALGRDDEAPDRQVNMQALRLLGAWLLIKDGWDDCAARRAYFFFVKSLMALVPDAYTEPLAELAMRCLTMQGIVALGFSWADIRTLQPEVLAHKLRGAAAFSPNMSPDTWFQGQGSVRINEGFVELHCANRDDAQYARTASSLMLFDHALSAQTVASNRIQQKDEDDLEAMNKFTQEFIHGLDRVRPSSDQHLLSYAEGDIMPVRYLGKDRLGNLKVETVEDTHHKLVGQIRYASIVFPSASWAYRADTVSKYLPEGCIFDAELVGRNRFGEEFSLEKPFLEALLRAIDVGKEVLAVLKKTTKRGLTIWWTADGYPAYVESEGCSQQFEVGQSALLYIENRTVNNGYVYARVVGPSDDTVDEDESRRFCVEHLLYDDGFVPAAPSRWDTIDANLVNGLVRLLFRYQRSLAQVSERFRVLCVCRILATMTADTAAADHIAVACDYLRDLALFSSGCIDRIKPLNPAPELAAEPSIARRMGIVRILQDYGLEADSEHLSEVIRTSDDPLLVQLAKLVQSCNRIDDVYPTIKTVIKREITKFLAVETEDSTDFEEAVGPNLGMESSRVEFKTSFFFAPANAYEQNQEKNIFRSLCSFLNAPEGGTLYLGVNDSGGINGLDGELEALGKRAPGYSGLDGYIRYITDRARNYFDLDVRIHFHIEPAYDNRIVAIRVEPYECGVVEFEGVPYIRNNIESVKMSQTLRRQIEAKRIDAQRGSPVKNIVALNEAMREERQVVIHGYPAHGPLTVEPFAFAGNRDFLWAYDVVADTNRVLRISRIGNVQITADRWAHRDHHQSGPLDIFHCTGASPVAVRLDLDIVAKNILVEEHPEAASDIEELDGERYMLSTNILDISGIGRFYCGLADHITIVDAPGLTEYAKAHFERALQRL